MDLYNVERISLHEDVLVRNSGLWLWVILTRGLGEKGWPLARGLERHVPNTTCISANPTQVVLDAIST